MRRAGAPAVPQSRAPPVSCPTSTCEATGSSAGHRRGRLIDGHSQTDPSMMTTQAPPTRTRSPCRRASSRLRRPIATPWDTTSASVP